MNGGTPVLARGLAATEKYEKERTAAPHSEAALIDKETDAERAAASLTFPKSLPACACPIFPACFSSTIQRPAPTRRGRTNRGRRQSQRPRQHPPRSLNPIASGKQSIEIEGEHAAVYAHVAVPSIYINIDDDSSSGASGKSPNPTADNSASSQRPQQPQQPEQAIVPFDRFHIVRVKIKSGKRIVGDIKRTPAGKMSQEQNSVKTTIDSVGTGWFKLPHRRPRTGEYAIIETKGSEGMNLFVWPFAVIPTPPQPQPVEARQEIIL